MPPTKRTRGQLITLIHVAKKDLAMADDSYRAILTQVAGLDSTAKMSVPQLDKVLQHMIDCGFKIKGGPGKAGSRKMADDAQSKKIRALWLDMHAAGIVINPSEAALASYVKRMTGKDALQFISSAQASKVIEELKKWQARESKKQMEVV